MLLPAAHADTELIEVVRITDPVKAMTGNDLVGECVALWAADKAAAALALVGALPDGIRYRCFMPGWGIRAHGAQELLFSAAFCFRCNGVRFWGPSGPGGQQGIRTFDAQSPAAVALLERFQAAGTGAPDGGARPGW